jgi:phage shock protein A
MGYVRDRRIEKLLRNIHQEIANMAIDLTAFQAEIARNTSIVASVKQVLDTLKGQVDTLTQQLANAGVDPATLTALADMQATLQANDDLAAAAVATDGGGTVPPTPAPAPTPSP